MGYAAQQPWAVYLDHRKLEEAGKELRQAILLEPDWGPPYGNLASLLLQQERFDDALTLARKGVKLKADMPEAYLVLGQAQRQKGLYGEAVASCETALAMCRKSPYYDYLLVGVYYDLGKNLEVNGLVPKAANALKAAVRLEPNSPRYQNDLAIVLIKTNQLDEALVAAREAVRLGGDTPQAHLNLGEALRRKKRLEEAITSFRK